MGDLLARPEHRDIQFIGMIRTNNASEIHGAASNREGVIDPKFVAQFARAHEENGFERSRLLIRTGDRGAVTGSGR